MHVRAYVCVPTHVILCYFILIFLKLQKLLLVEFNITFGISLIREKCKKMEWDVAKVLPTNSST